MSMTIETARLIPLPPEPVDPSPDGIWDDARIITALDLEAAWKRANDLQVERDDALAARKEANEEKQRVVQLYQGMAAEIQQLLYGYWQQLPAEFVRLAMDATMK